MSLVKDYAAFAARFTGVAYVVVYVLTAPEVGMPAAWLLPVVVPPGLHLIGALAAGFVVAESVRTLLQRGRNVPPEEKPASRPQPLRLRQRGPAPTSVKRRNHFGLRGVPR